MMPYLELKKMLFHSYHGIMEQERKVGNTYIIDLKIYFDFNQATYSDNLEDTIDYALVYEIVKQEMAVPSKLIEHVAGRIIRHIRIELPQVKNVEIRLAKKNPPFGGDIEEAAVVIDTSSR
ncbi:MAG: dihydroneopterin aldolase [Dysgonamonadaceae bacterium]|nr:dihydroneopterin aldolase [Dysgonamonadaceae bacterium]